MQFFRSSRLTDHHRCKASGESDKPSVKFLQLFSFAMRRDGLLGAQGVANPRKPCISPLNRGGDTL